MHFERPVDDATDLDADPSIGEEEPTKIKSPRNIPQTNKFRLESRDEPITDPDGPSMLEAPSSREMLTPTLRTAALNTEAIRELGQRAPSQIPMYILTIVLAIAVGVSIGFLAGQ